MSVPSYCHSSADFLSKENGKERTTTRIAMFSRKNAQSGHSLAAEWNFQMTSLPTNVRREFGARIKHFSSNHPIFPTRREAKAQSFRARVSLYCNCITSEQDVFSPLQPSTQQFNQLPLEKQTTVCTICSLIPISK